MRPAGPGWAFLRYRERLYLRHALETIGRNLCEVWDGANALPMLSLGGVLKFKPEEGRGLSLAELRARGGTRRLPHGGARVASPCACARAASVCGWTPAGRAAR